MKIGVPAFLVALFVFAPLQGQKKTTFIYSIKDSDTLRLDVYTPDNLNPEREYPTFLWIHGGGFAVGARDYKDDAQLGLTLAQKGFIMVSISYRLLRKDKESGFGCNCPKEVKIETFKQAVIDYMDAAKFIVENAERLQIDSTKIIAAGSSAGAETVLNAVYMQEFFLDDVMPYEDVNFAGVWSLAGAMVNANYITEKNAIPTALFHGTNDKLVPYASSPHHYCQPSDLGYLWLDGSEIIQSKLQDLESPYYFYSVLNGNHDVAEIPYDQRLDDVLEFFEKTAFQRAIIQIKKNIHS